MSDAKSVPPPSLAATATTSTSGNKHGNKYKGGESDETGSASVGCRPRRRPEVQHYKPGAFNNSSSSSRRDDVEVVPPPGGHQDKQQQQETNVSSKSQRRKGGGSGNKNSGKKQQHEAIVSKLTGKVDGMTLDGGRSGNNHEGGTAAPTCSSSSFKTSTSRGMNKKKLTPPAGENAPKGKDEATEKSKTAATNVPPSQFKEERPDQQRQQGGGGASRNKNRNKGGGGKRGDGNQHHRKFENQVEGESETVKDHSHSEQQPAESSRMNGYDEGRDRQQQHQHRQQRSGVKGQQQEKGGKNEEVKDEVENKGRGGGRNRRAGGGSEQHAKDRHRTKVSDHPDSKRLFDPKKSSTSDALPDRDNKRSPGSSNNVLTAEVAKKNQQRGILTIHRRSPSPKQQQPLSLPPSYPHPASADRKSHSPPSPALPTSSSAAKQPFSRGGLSSKVSSSFREDRHHRDWRGGSDRGRGQQRSSWDYSSSRLVQKPSVPPRFLRAQQQQNFSDEFRRAHGGSASDWSWRSGREGEEGQEEQQRQKVDSGARTDISSSSVSKDWGLEVEEEQLAAAAVQRQEEEKEKGRCTGGNVAGLIRFPNNHHPSSGALNSWRSEGLPNVDAVATQEVQQQEQRPQRCLNYEGMSVPSRYLFDPKNPNKPIAIAAAAAAAATATAAAAAARPSNNGDRPPFPPPSTAAARFPIDPRFVHPQAVTAAAIFQQPQTYRPPFSHHHNPRFNPLPPRPQERMQQWTRPEETTALIKTIGYCELQLGNIVLGGGGHLLCRLWDSDVASYRQQILKSFRRLLETDLMHCVVHDVEFDIWKNCFYWLLEVLKPLQKADDQEEDVRKSADKNIFALLEEGLEFYAEMLDTLDKTYRVGLDKHFDVLEPRVTDKFVNYVLISAQKCLLCLGDLARYKEMIQGTTNYGKARQYYQKASHIDTRNGRPYNQLAILAGATKRRFEAVYFNMRCLATRNPVQSSQETLTVIFEEVRKKWEAAELKRLEEKNKEGRAETTTSTSRLRKEIWMRPEGGRSVSHHHRAVSSGGGDGDDKDNEIELLSTSDLNRRFNNSFLYLIGKLYTNINMDAFPLALDLLLKEFRILLSRSPLPIDSKRLVQIMALNMFIIEHTKNKSGGGGGTTTKKSALTLAFHMLGVLLERCNILLQGFTVPPSLAPNTQTIFPDSDDLPAVLSAVKVWCDWLLGNNDTWFPIVVLQPFKELARLATHLEHLKPTLQPVLRQMVREGETSASSTSSGLGGDYQLVKLGEDALLCGFLPWFRGLDWAVYRRYCHKSVAPTLAQDVRRLDAINDCIDYLEGFDPPILKWSKPDNAHISLLKEKRKVCHPGGRALLEESDEDVKPVARPPPQSDLDATVDNATIRLLKLRKEELEKRKEDEEHRRNLLQQQLLSDVSVTLEVCPRILVPDTNCFVDFLPDLRKLATSGQFQLRVPLVVLNELEGLAKGARPTKYASQEHAAMVAENARLALNFLHERPANTCCVTSSGKVLKSSCVIFSEEDAGNGKKNDDLILDTCIHLSDSETTTSTKKEKRVGPEEAGTRHVYREVVLLTEDRNLKLKAHTTDIPVNKLSDFLQWVYSK